MKIKKVDDKPMVIHTKEKAKIHAHEPKGAKIKGSNIYTVERGPKVHDAKANEMDKKASAKLMLQKSAGGKRTYRKSTIHQSEAKDKGLSRFKRNIRESGTSIKTKNTNLHIAGRTGALAAGAVTEQVEGGHEVSQAAYLAYESTMMLEAISKCKTGETTAIGKFHGFELLVEKNFLGINYMVLRGKTEYKAELSTSPVGSMVKHENVDFLEKKIEQYQNDLEASKAEYPVMEGTTSKVLNAGIGHIEETAGIGESGNCVLCGHNGSRYGTFFTPLSQISIGDEVMITDKNGLRHIYEVTETEVVNPYDKQNGYGSRKNTYQ